MGVFRYPLLPRLGGKEAAWELNYLNQNFQNLQDYQNSEKHLSTSTSETKVWSTNSFSTRNSILKILKFRKFWFRQRLCPCGALQFKRYTSKGGLAPFWKPPLSLQGCCPCNPRTLICYASMARSGKPLNAPYLAWRGKQRHTALSPSRNEH
jgi:hypothetical protein